ncbi:TNFAIP3-interacting protein 1 isoform X1 [Canis lupus baileyi]|uniref:TNFAIP3-interacting protein 1 n=3 Tax=Canis lupus TaxID=9612 RepID=A0A8C0M6K9_CANLF|nr:TNFAIP3-interacting protein 1 isoform X1 [Canis lupus dingo]XP_025291163.1 TNFAIP3-interacting protein 1 isoform X1 [Canis lupus dingo]XP_038353069.1 TNFAIP3-interacting protein 1 isoform X1 [Canis lupus familiaris]XP_038390918.1 TNFAIP3-interacting protein 1 isoform X1 [Canis lupus familiaris]XP_038390919.1 TNFAIP3-interacting protein 1 isoform X1 [Canis lupus familiaris]XP_038519525.1 TNFAIP3-interacting protein 1 isoform X1 [Canis lupus familiaris]XP_038519526.1 TNFAIP3-interacting prot|eukprot:XP_546296.3 TNFAIP3-interacting protein 1 isoform X1 [Canis lupus familiaris]
MEGRGPYRIYDPGGGVPLGEASAAFERLVEENSRLKEKMQGIKMLGELLEESQMEASRLRQKAEELVKDSDLLPPPSPSLTSFDHLAELTGKDAGVPAPPADPAHPSDKSQPVPKPPSSGTSSEFEVVTTEEQKSPPVNGGRTRNTMELGPLPHEDSNLLLHLQRLETTLSVCAEEPDRSQLFMHLGRMALEFNRLASKVHKNEQRTSILQTLCEQLRKENEALKAKLDKGLEQRDQAAERLREENMELKKLLMSCGKDDACGQPGSPKIEGVGKKGVAGQQQACVTAAKIPEVGALGAAEKKVKMLEQQRTELLEVNKQWDQHFRSMKQQYEQKITELRQKLADLQKQVTDLEAEREQKQRDFDRKLLLAKSKIEMEETDKEQLTAEAKELRQKVKYLQDQLSPLTRQREYQEKEIQRLNKALEEALSIQASPSSPPAFGGPEGASGLLRKQELVTQNELLKQQVKIFEEDFQRERSDRERMNEEKEELKKQVEKLQAQVTLSNAQLKAFKDEEKTKEALKQQKRKAKASAERYHVEPHPEHLCGAYPYAYAPMPPMVPHHGFEDWSQIRYPPPPMAMEHTPPLPNSRLFHLPEYTWRPPCGGMRNQSSQVMDSPTARPVEPESTKNDREGPQ